MSRKLKTPLFLLLVVLLAIGVVQRQHDVLEWRAIPQSGEANPDRAERPVFHRGMVFEQGMTPRVHAPAIVELAGGEMLAVWYGGSREGAGDVGLYAARKPAAADSWSAPRKIYDRQRLAADLGRHIRKLGNPVLLADRQGRVWLFFVSTSIGGWSTSAINVTLSLDNGTSWNKARRLVTSPFLNISTLVKGRPYLYQDGSIGLPAYHELMGKFAELLRVSPDGLVLDKVRLTHGRHSIQPSIVALTEDKLLALLRNTGPSRRVLQLDSNQGGRHWSEEQATGLANPDAAVTVTGSPGQLVLVYNDSVDDRDRLAIALSEDQGRSWRHAYQLEAGDPHQDKPEYSYPYLVSASDGTYHLVYTWQRTRIAHVQFNEAWLEQLP